MSGISNGCCLPTCSTTTRSANIRATTIGSCFLRGRRQEGTWERCSLENDWGAAEVLREGSGIKVDGTAGHELTISTHIKDAGNLPWQKALPGLIYHQRAQRNEFWLRARTRTSFFTIRGHASVQLQPDHVPSSTGRYSSANVNPTLKSLGCNRS